MCVWLVEGRFYVVDNIEEGGGYKVVLYIWLDYYSDYDI